MACCIWCLSWLMQHDWPPPRGRMHRGAGRQPRRDAACDLMKGAWGALGGRIWVACLATAPGPRPAGDGNSGSKRDILAPEGRLTYLDGKRNADHCGSFRIKGSLRLSRSIGGIDEQLSMRWLKVIGVTDCSEKPKLKRSYRPIHSSNIVFLRFTQLVYSVLRSKFDIFSHDLVATISNHIELKFIFVTSRDKIYVSPQLWILVTYTPTSLSCKVSDISDQVLKSD